MTRGTFFLAILCSIVIVFATLNLPKTLNEPQGNIECGWPLPFFVTDNRFNPPYPWTEDCIAWAGSPQEAKKEILWIPFLTNVAIVFGVIWVGIFLIRKVRKKFRF